MGLHCFSDQKLVLIQRTELKHKVKNLELRMFKQLQHNSYQLFSTLHSECRSEPIIIVQSISPPLVPVYYVHDIISPRPATLTRDRVYKII